MKHDSRVIGILILMFVVTQLIGLVVIDSYSEKITKTYVIDGVEKNITLGEIPYDLEPPEIAPKDAFGSITIAFVIAVVLFFFLSKLRANLLIQIWFTLVVFLTVAVALNGLLLKSYQPLGIEISIVKLFPWIAGAIAIPLTFFKTIKRNLIVHNVSELLIYPGLAAIFVPILRPWSIVALLLLISVYDMWAVWHSKFMIKLAKYQIENLKVFTGFFLPYVRQTDRVKLKKIQTIKSKSKAMKAIKKSKIKVSLALLGGGDVAFPLIFAGVVMRWGTGFVPALFVVAGATLGLLGLFIYSKKGKFYPAMPFITVGCLIGWGISFLF
ncbi:presenilin family intramembrane aspartyl protease [Nanoarchaeota archaeon]